MNKQDYEQFVNALNGVAEYLGKPRMSEVQISVYWALLDRFSLDEVKRGITAHLTDPKAGQFMPKAADIIRQLGGDEDRAAAAWGKVMRGLVAGPYKRVVFDDPVIHAAIESVGWYGLCMASYEQLAFRQRDFEQAYQANLGATNVPGCLCALPLDEPGEVVLIGDPGRAQQVLAMGRVAQNRISSPQDIRAITSNYRQQEDQP